MAGPSTSESESKPPGLDRTEFSQAQGLELLRTSQSSSTGAPPIPDIPDTTALLGPVQNLAFMLANQQEQLAQNNKRMEATAKNRRKLTEVLRELVGILGAGRVPQVQGQAASSEPAASSPGAASSGEVPPHPTAFSSTEEQTRKKFRCFVCNRESSSPG